MKPKIAIPAATLTEATNVINERNAPFAPRPIIEAVVKSGGVPIIFPSVQPDLAPKYLETFDGIVFAGGADVDPTFYGQEPHMNLGMTYRKRDLFEIALLKGAVQSGKAILGICRGMQLINIGLGGTVYQDLSENPDAHLKHVQGAPGNLPSHHIDVDLDSRLYKLIGKHPYINSRHHQAIDRVAPSLKVAARAQDLVVEALESSDSDQILAVQWHPENMYKHYRESQALFGDFIRRSAKVAAKRHHTDNQNN